MPAFAAITLLNNAAANVIFNPQSLDAKGVATYLTGDAVFDAKMRFTHSVSLPKNGSTVSRVKQKIVVPVMDTVDPSKKVCEPYINIEYVIPKNTPESVRLDMPKYGASLASHAVTKAAVQNFESVY